MKGPAGLRRAPAAAVAPGNGSGAGLRSCLALGALAAAGQMLAGQALEDIRAGLAPIG